ncbi:DUF6850 family outer membrane beta-barrel protein [Chryseobacterium sp. CT-SW4]|uniref:DUF6850 family outer membrane beta-barrel protein n=1 Tax=Chryseobacterium sp. SW-1 TaxID=3157343 RepID=UPI003B014A8D
MQNNLNYKNIFSARAKVIFGLCWLFSCHSIIYGQENHLDTINIDYLEKEMRIQNPEMAFKNGMDFSNAYLYLDYSKLDFKRTQTPGSTTKYGFGSSGVFQYNSKIILSGKLEVSREDEKDVPFILTDERTTDQNYISNPSYFYAPRNSDWMKQNYQIGGNIAYTPVKNLFMVVGIDGKFTKAYSNSDPRPKIGNFNYTASGKLGYQLSNHSLFVKTSYFNRKKESDISYSVSELNAPSYYETYIRFNQGYGNYYYNDGFSDTEYKYDGWSYGAEYNFNNGETYLNAGYNNEYYIDRMTRRYSYQTQDANGVLRTFYDIKKLTGLQTERNTYHINYLGNIKDWKWSSLLKLTDQQDINYDYVNKYTSYRVYNTEIKFNNVWSKYNKKGELLRLILDAGYGDQDIKDISVVLQKKLRFLTYQIGGEKEFKVKPDQKISLEVKHSLYLPLENVINYEPYQSSNSNIFVENIVMPDYLYDSSTHMSLNMKVKYLLNIKKVRYEFYASGGQMFYVNSDNKNVKVVLNISNNSYFAVGLNFYY